MKVLIISFLLVLTAACCQDPKSEAASQETETKRPYRVKAAGYTLDCAEISRSRFYVYTLKNCKCWHSGQFIEVVYSAQGVIKFGDQ